MSFRKVLLSTSLAALLATSFALNAVAADTAADTQAGEQGATTLRKPFEEVVPKSAIGYKDVQTSFARLQTIYEAVVKGIADRDAKVAADAAPSTTTDSSAATGATTAPAATDSEKENSAFDNVNSKDLDKTVITVNLPEGPVEMTLGDAKMQMLNLYYFSVLPLLGQQYSHFNQSGYNLDLVNYFEGHEGVFAKVFGTYEKDDYLKYWTSNLTLGYAAKLAENAKAGVFLGLGVDRLDYTVGPIQATNFGLVNANFGAYGDVNVKGVRLSGLFDVTVKNTTVDSEHDLSVLKTGEAKVKNTYPNSDKYQVSPATMSLTLKAAYDYKVNSNFTVTPFAHYQFLYDTKQDVTLWNYALDYNFQRPALLTNALGAGVKADYAVNSKFSLGAEVNGTFYYTYANKIQTSTEVLPQLTEAQKVRNPGYIVSYSNSDVRVAGNAYAIYKATENSSFDVKAGYSMYTNSKLHGVDYSVNYNLKF